MSLSQRTISQKDIDTYGVMGANYCIDFLNQRNDIKAVLPPTEMYKSGDVLVDNSGYVCLYEAGVRPKSPWRMNPKTRHWYFAFSDMSIMERKTDPFTDPTWNKPKPEVFVEFDEANVHCYVILASDVIKYLDNRRAGWKNNDNGRVEYMNNPYVPRNLCLFLHKDDVGKWQVCEICTNGETESQRKIKQLLRYECIT